MRLETRPLSLEAGIVLLLVNWVLLLASWVTAHVYAQSKLGLQMAINMDVQLQAQMKAEDELIEIVKTTALHFKQDPYRYLVWHREKYKQERLVFIPDLPSVACLPEVGCSGRDLYTLSVSGYRCTYWIRFDIKSQTNNDVEILSWSHENP